uniref:Threonylcarbamoyl-AMP synthase n=1 Tax=Knipowitschia caucasica TaxID=637954 RepID=A0AAV2MJ30_KNICA
MTLHLSVGILSISGGSLLLLINNYGSVSGNATTFIPHTTLGTLLLIAAALSAYAAVSRCLSHAQLFSTLCLSISALWSALGLVHILFGQRILTEDEFRFALIPGLATFSFALFLIAIIATLIVDLSVGGFGHKATAANYLLVFLVCAYFGIGRLLSVITGGKVEFLGAGLKDKVVSKAEESMYCDVTIVGHACNLLAAFALTGTEEDTTSLLPWVVVGGGLLQILCGLVAFSRGKTFESTVFVLYGILWAFWGSVRYGSLYGDVRVGYLPYGYDIGVAIIFGAVSLYCFGAKMFSSTFQSPLIPLGKPIIKLSGVGGGAQICPHLPARKATSVQQIADIMKNGGVCGMPTDTVYVSKSLQGEKAGRGPMSMWISSIKQLQPVRHLLSPLLLDFMEAAWPSSISMVLPRGPWMEVFGLGDAAKHIGTPQSIAIRNPDCAVATHLMNMVGPIAVTSANPTGEADTTHHNQVFAKLGDKVDGVLCDGPSPENIASTVVDCTKIESGQIGFFRVGLIPKSKVLQIFEEVQKRHRHGQTNAAFESETNSVTMENANPLAR